MNWMRSVRGRQVLTLAGTAALPAVLVFGFGHRGVHAARSLLLPGAGLFEQHLGVGVLFLVLAIAATVGWLRWGMDWAVLAVVTLAAGASFALASSSAHAPAAASAPVAAAHEFPLVLLVVGALSWVRVALGRIPVVRRATARRAKQRAGLADLAALPPVDRCRAAALVGLVLRITDAPIREASEAVERDDVRRRATRIGAAARFRTGGDPFRRDHATARSARVLLGLADAGEIGTFAADAGRSALGVPCCEPGWIRPLDGTLAAVALAVTGGPECGEPWRRALAHELALVPGRRGSGRRPSWWWTPLGVAGPAAPTWEHATFTGIARAAGWIGDEDWPALRTAMLGAAARGGDHPHDERLIAAARLWLASVDDPQAARIVQRPGVRRDPLACALDALATALLGRPGGLPSLFRTVPSGDVPYDKVVSA